MYKRKYIIRIIMFLVNLFHENKLLHYSKLKTNHNNVST